MQVGDVLEESTKRLDVLNPQSPEDVQRHGIQILAHSERMKNLNRTLKDFLYANMYFHYRVARMAKRAELFLTQTFESYVEEPRQLPMEYQAQLKDRDTRRVVADYISAMTDRGALLEYRRLFDPLARP
jgi:dGTPase